MFENVCICESIGVCVRVLASVSVCMCMLVYMSIYVRMFKL